MIGITRYKEDIIIWASIECVKEDSGMLKTTPSKRERIPTIASPIPSGYANSFIALVIFAWNVAVEFRVDPTNIAPLLPLLLLCPPNGSLVVVVPVARTPLLFGASSGSPLAPLRNKLETT